MISPRSCLEDIDVQRTFPSLFISLNHSREDAYGAGKLLRIMNNIAYCLILTLFQGDATGVLNSFAILQQRTVQYMQDPGSVLSHKIYESSARCIEIHLFNDLVIRLEGLYSSSLFETEQDEIFISILFNSAIQYYYDGDVDHVDTTNLIRRWHDARDIGTDESTSPSVELTPDPTPTEYERCGPRIPVHESSKPYLASSVPDEKCAICCWEFKESIEKVLV
ncbi:hypothetical protein BDU57DRAFT_563429 [Ampelomyces quisqualis]|uniref:Uncharacterized protein n=1 Tax=Ampelomyces quisqualis TaxID=50730 RepID=A0A6A5R099_AMPQU|nr:hypothetical protein BDU57DRAFT_563429 [Ampelomyces quisqualis]